MTAQDAFSRCHPAVSFVYFALVLLFSMFLMHPVCLGISLLGAGCYVLRLHGAAGLGRRLGYLLPMMVLAALLNPAFNHRGVTVLAFLPDGNPLTLESVLYGLAAAGMLGAVTLWFVCFSAVMTSDKLICLFGRVIPGLSLVLTMALRFIPRFVAQFRAVREARSCLDGERAGRRSPFRRLKTAVTALSAVLTWSLENAIDTADSMKSRGYGLPGRTSFSLYRFDRRDRLALAWLLSCGLFLLLGWGMGGFAWRYFPSVKGDNITPVALCSFAVYFALCLTPVAVNGWDALRWRRAQREGALA